MAEVHIPLTPENAQKYPRPIDLASDLLKWKEFHYASDGVPVDQKDSLENVPVYKIGECIATITYIQENGYTVAHILDIPSNKYGDLLTRLAREALS